MSEASSSEPAAHEGEKETKCGQLLFAELCDTFDKVEQQSSKRDKLESIFTTLRRKWVRGQSMFPLIRLVLANIDTRVYGLKEKKLAGIFFEVLRLNADSADGKKLQYHMGNQRGVFVDGGLAKTVEDVISTRIDLTRSRATIADVNDYLDRLVKAGGNKEDSKRVVEGSHQKFSAREHKWLLRIILAEMKLGIQESQLLGHLHENALDAYSKHQNLRKVCADFSKDGPGRKRAKEGLDGQQESIELGAHFQPQKAQGYSSAPDQSAKVEEVLRVKKKKKAKRAPRGEEAEPETPAADVPGFVADEKLDGERMVCHKVGNKISFFTNNGLDYSADYAILADQVRTRLANCRDCVLDGEVVAVDRFSRRNLPFGNNRTVAKMERARMTARDNTRKDENELVAFLVNNIVKRENPDEEDDDRFFEAKDDNGDKAVIAKVTEETLKDARLEYVVFDCIYIDGDENMLREILPSTLRQDDKPRGSILHWPLHHRRFVLYKLVVEKAASASRTTEDAIMTTTTTPAADVEDNGCYNDELRLSYIDHIAVAKGTPKTERVAMLRKFYEGIVLKGGEGAVVKDLTSPYCCGFHNRSRSGWHKMKPEYEGNAPTVDLVIVGGFWSDAIKGSRRGKLTGFMVAALDAGGCLVPVGKVATGINAVIYEAIHRRIGAENWVTFDTRDLPGYLVDRAFTKVKPDNRPDMVISDITRSAVLEVKFMELLPSDQYAGGLSFRFPRTERYRVDKAWNDIENMENMKEMCKNPKRGVESSSTQERKKKAASRAARVRPQEQVNQTELRKARDEGREQFFKDDIFYILTNASLVEEEHEEVEEQEEPHDEEDDDDGPKKKKTKKTVGIQEIQKKLAAHGGRCCGMLSSQLTDVVGVGTRGRDETKISLYRANPPVSFVDTSWLERCLAAGRRLPRTPRDLILASEAEAAKMRLEYDSVWGAHFLEPTSAEELIESRRVALLERNRVHEAPSALYKPLPEVLSTEGGATCEATCEELMRKVRTAHRCLVGVVAYLDDDAAPLAPRLRLYGARLASDPNDAAITHYLRGADNTELLPCSSLKALVNSRWLDDCIQQATVLTPQPHHHLWHA